MKTAIEILAAIKELGNNPDPAAMASISAAIMRLERPIVLPAGKYWVGDLCYSMSDRWDEVCAMTIDGEKTLSGLFQLADGTKFGFLNTAWGDGLYYDQHGREYPVDAGLIGCILVSDVDEGFDLDGGNVYTFPHEFYIWAHGESTDRPNILNFGGGVVVIDTNADEEDDSDEDEDEEEER